MPLVGQRTSAEWSVLSAIVIVAVALCTVECIPRTEVFTNSFLVRFRRDMTRKEASGVANVHGFVNLGPVSTLRRDTSLDIMEWSGEPLTLCISALSFVGRCGHWVRGSGIL